MLTQTAEYSAAREELATQPRQLLRFTNPSVYGSATEFPFSVDFVSQNDLVAPTKAQRPWIMEIAGNTQVVEPELGRSSNGGFRIRLLDVGGEMVKYFADVVLTLNGAHDASTTTIIANEDTSGYPMIGTVELLTGGVRERVRYTGKTPKTFTGCTRGVDGTSAASHSSGDPVHNGEQIRLGTRCQVKTGYAHLAEASWCDIQKMEVVDLAGHQDRVSVVLKIADINRQPSRATIFLTASQVAPRALFGNPIDCALAVLISAGTFTALAGTLTKTVGSTAVTGTGTDWNVSLAVGDCVRAADGELLRVAGGLAAGAFTAAQAVIQTATGVTARKGGTGGKYDVLDAVDAIGIPAVFVDVTTWEALRTSDFSTDQYYFPIVAPQPAKAFIEDQFFKTLNAYGRINQTGQLSILRYRVAVGTPTVTLDMTTIRSYGWMPALAQVINRVHFRWDFNVPAAPGQYGAFVEYIAGTPSDFTTSRGQFGPKTPLVVEAMGWRSNLGAAAMAAARAKQTTDRFAFPQTILALDCHYTQHHLEVGDQVYVNDPRIPNIRTGGKGISNEVFEVLDVTPSWRPYHVAFTLLWVAAIPTVPAPISQGEVSTPSPLIGYETLGLDAGIKLAGSATRFHVVTGAGSPRSAYRVVTDPAPVQALSFTIATGDQLEYAVWVHSSSLDTRVGVDLAVWSRPINEVVGTGGNDATHVKLNAAASAVNDFYNGQIMQLSVGANPLQYRYIDDYDGTTKIATISPAWTNNPVDATSYYNLFDVLRNPAQAVVDQAGVSMAPSTALGAPAQGRWYVRRCTVPAVWNGSSFAHAAIGMDQVTGETVAYLVEVRLLTSTGALRHNLLRYNFADLDVVWVFGHGTTPNVDQNITSASHGVITAAVPSDGAG